MRFLSLIVKNSLRNRRRSILTIGSIGVSLCLLGVLLAVYQALFHSDPTPAQALRLVTRHKVGLAQPLPNSYLPRIERVPGVKGAMIWQWFGGKYKDERDTKNFFARFGCQPDRLHVMRPEYTMPEDWWKRFISDRTSAIISRRTAGELGLHIGDRVTLVGDIFPVTLELHLVGIFNDPLNEQSLYFHYDYLNESLAPTSGQRNTVGTFQILADTPSDVPRIAETIDKEFDNSPAPTKTETEQQFALSFVSFLGNLKLFLMAICGAVTFTILLVSANTISMSVRERVREVGVLKTLGFTPSNILGIILGESIVTSLIGGAIGCLLASGMCLVARSGLGLFVTNLTLTPGVAAISMAVALMVGLVSSFLPAWSASRTSILDSLRFSG
jgi:putative ABC transport system permease protein